MSLAMRVYDYYPTPGCENQWIWAVVSKGVDTTGPNLHIGYNTLICMSVARRACVFMAFMPYLATLDLLLMPKVNCMYRLYDSFNNPLLYWLHNAVCSKYSLDKITKREIIKRLFCHVTHGDMTSQLDITWQRGKTIANVCLHLFENLQTAWLKIIFRESIYVRYMRSLIYSWI